MTIVVVMQMSQQLGQAQQKAQASVEALEEQMQRELDRKYSWVLLHCCSSSVGSNSMHGTLLG